MIRREVGSFSPKNWIGSTPGRTRCSTDSLAAESARTYAPNAGSPAQAYNGAPPPPLTI